jgi:hypothetical protein
MDNPADHLRHLVLGARVAQCIAIVARLRIADLLRDGPLTIGEIATSTGAHGPSLYRVMRLLASEGVFEEVAREQFALTPAAAFLRSDVPGSLRAWAVYEGADFTWWAWGDLGHTVLTGEPAFEHVFGMPYFAYLADHPESAGVFQDNMAAETRLTAEAVAAAWDLSNVQTLIDVGGGRGALLIEALRRYPCLRTTLVDQPGVVAEARQILAGAGVADRCSCQAGDFFHEVPAGGDVYILKSILHDWDDERTLAILRTCRRAMAGTSRLMVIEAIIPPGNEPDYGKSLDVIMLALLRGRERTEAEYRALLEDAGFTLDRTVPTASYLTILEASPA